MKKKTTKTTKSHVKPVNPMKLAVMAFVVTFAVIGAAFVFASSAAPALPTGTIAIGPNSVMQYGNKAYFDTTVSGKIAPKGYTYVRVVCKDATPGIATTVVYQWSKDASLASTEGFPLVDQTGQNLQWDGQAAQCIADHVYRVDGKNPTIHTMATTGWFNVAAAQ